jgi:hypothetical protein
MSNPGLLDAQPSGDTEGGLTRYAILGRSEPLYGIRTRNHYDSISEAHRALQTAEKRSPEYTPWRIIQLNYRVG